MLKMKKQIAKKNSGFTLIELLVVVAIIAILALIALLAINPVEMARRSRDSRRLSDLGTLRRAIDLSLADNKTLPTTVGDVSLTSMDATNLGGTGLDISKYLSVVTQDPQYKSGDASVIQTTDGTCPSGVGSTQKQNMVYTFNSDGSGYVLSGRLESTDNCGVPSGDGGNDNDKYELGNDPGLNL